MDSNKKISMPWEGKVKNFLPYCNSEEEAKLLAVSVDLVHDGYAMYPLTIINDRYTGTYSGAEFTAWPLDFYDVPKEIDDTDPVCNKFWKEYKGIVGKGSTIMEAYENLEDILNEIWNKE